MSYRIIGLDSAPFQDLFGLPDADLARRGVKRYTADTKPGYPDRIELRDAEPGETVLLLNYTHLPANSPYRASHAIYIREGATHAETLVDRVPDVLRSRLISLRAFDEDSMMLDADVVEGAALETLIERLLSNPDVSFLHAHFARRGCYAARIERT